MRSQIAPAIKECGRRAEFDTYDARDSESRITHHGSGARAAVSLAIIAASGFASENGFELSNILGFSAIILAAINIFGGFMVTQRMLQMYKKKKKTKVK